MGEYRVCLYPVWCVGLYGAARVPADQVGEVSVQKNLQLRKYCRCVVFVSFFGFVWIAATSLWLI